MLVTETLLSVLYSFLYIKNIYIYTPRFKNPEVLKDNNVKHVSAGSSGPKIASGAYPSRQCCEQNRSALKEVCHRWPALSAHPILHSKHI